MDLLAPWIIQWLRRFWDGNYSCSPPGLRDLNLTYAGREELVQPHLKTWSVSSGHTESVLGAFRNGRRGRAQANSSEVKSLKSWVISLSDGVDIFQRTDISLFTSLADERSLTL